MSLKVCSSAFLLSCVVLFSQNLQWSVLFKNNYMFHFIVETEELKGLDVDELEAVSAEKYGPGRARTRVVKPMPYPCGYCNL